MNDIVRAAQALCRKLREEQSVTVLTPYGVGPIVTTHTDELAALEGALIAHAADKAQCVFCGQTAPHKVAYCGDVGCPSILGRRER